MGRHGWRGTGEPRGILRARGALVGAVLIALGAGCGSIRVTNTARSATEQMLLTEAWDKAMRCVDFGPLVGTPAYLDTTGLTAPDGGWITFRLRQALLRQGVRLVEKKDEATYLVEVGVGTYGTDDHDWRIGTPGVALPGVVPGIPVAAIPEISVARKNKQYGVVKLALFAHDRLTGQYVWESPTIVADVTLKNVYVGSLGPFQSGSLSRQQGLEREIREGAGL